MLSLSIHSAYDEFAHLAAFLELFLHSYDLSVSCLATYGEAGGDIAYLHCSCQV